ASAKDVIRAKLREHIDDFPRREHTRVAQAKRFLTFEVIAQVSKMRIPGGDKEVSLRAIAGRMSQAFVEGCVEGNGIERHLDVHGSGELRANTAHALSRRSFSLSALALDDQHLPAARIGEMPGDA